jgi:ABC-2 type transport system permease protein
MGVRHALQIFGAYIRLHVKTAMEYRVNFFAQTFFMLLNDFLYIFLFYFLFSFVGSINGYMLKDVLVLQAIATYSFGLVVLLFGNAGSMWEMIQNGKLDFYLALPADPLFHAIISNSRYSGAGDVLFGIILMAAVAPSYLPLMFLFGLFGSMLFLSVFILSDCLGFYLQQPKSVTKAIKNVFLSFGSWPIDTFNSTAKIFLYVILIMFMVTVPYHLIVRFTWSEFLLLAVVSVGVLFLSIAVFRRGLRKYESGNLISMRV